MSHDSIHQNLLSEYVNGCNFALSANVCQGEFFSVYHFRIVLATLGPIVLLNEFSDLLIKVSGKIPQRF